MSVLLTDLAAGHSFNDTTFTVSAETVRDYCAAVQDSRALYAEAGVAPPLAVAALALGALLEHVTLPAGSLHASESLEMRKAVPLGAAVQCRAKLAQRSQRAGWVVSVLDTEMLVEGETALVARATVLSPAGES